MKNKLFIFFVPLLFMSCVSTKQTNEKTSTESNKKIYFYEPRNEFFATARGKIQEDGTAIIFYPNSPEYETGDIIEFSIKEAVTYYVIDSETQTARVFNKTSKDGEDLILQRKNIIPVKLLNYEMTYELENTGEKKSGRLLVDMSKKMRPLKLNSDTLVGTWVDVKDDKSRRCYTFKEDGSYVDEKNKSDKFYQTDNYFYRLVNENIILIEYNLFSLITGKTVRNFSLFFYDGKFLYDILFPIEDVSENEEVREAIRKTGN